MNMNGRAIHPRNRSPRRGAAMVLVTLALGIATAMSVGLLAANSVRAQCSRNALDSAVAHYLAESGANIAMYYVMFPTRYTGAKPSGYYPGENPVPLGAGAPGTVTSSVSYDSTSKVYTVSSVASVTGLAKNTYTRQIDATAQVVEPAPTQIEPIVDALVANGPITLGGSSYVDGNIRSLGSVAMSGGTVTGGISADSVTVSGTANVAGQTVSLVDGMLVADAAKGLTTTVDKAIGREGLAAVVPDASQVPDLRSYVGINALGVTITATAGKLITNKYGNLTLGPTLLNPQGVYWYDGDLEVEGRFTINGTLVMRGGRVKIKKDGVLELNPAAGFPALVSDRSIMLDASGVVVAQGLVQAKAIEVGSGSGANSGIGVLGALLLTDAVKPVPLPKDFSGTIAVRYDKAKADVRGIGTIRAPSFGRGVKLLAWTD
jgi:hypothetical protein